MNEVWEFFQKLFDTADFPPRWHCGFWSQFHGWLYICSDLAIWAAYFAIPIIILKFVAKKYDIRFTRVYFLFASFILACGSTHLLDAIMFWYPYYRINALMRFVTAIVSWITVYNLVKLMPVANTLKSAEEFEKEIERRKTVEEQLRINNKLLTEAQEIAKLGHWQWDVITNKVEWSDMTLKLYGLPPGNREMTYDEYLQKLHPDDREYVNNAVMEGFKTKVFPKFYHRIIWPNGQTKTMLSKGEVILGENGEVVTMIGTVQDITDLIKTEHELLLKTQKLESSNVELQKFASITSHDLREPLRKIMTFGSMLEREAAGKLGEKGEMYLKKVTEASSRMQKLIDSILDFSKLSTDNQEFSRINLNDIVRHVLSDMEVAIDVNKAEINSNQLPEIDGNASQLGQLFQNLLSNAIKFHRKGVAPIITVTGEVITADMLPAEVTQSSLYNFTVVRNPEFNKSERFCKITIQDNGIGFEETYLDKIFLIFQRLHDKSEYEGTGIGLAVVKKVTELHNGFITAKSKVGEGTMFTIILPVVHRHTNSPR